MQQRIFSFWSSALVLIMTLAACNNIGNTPSPTATTLPPTSVPVAGPEPTAATVADVAATTESEVPDDTAQDDTTIRMARATWDTGWFQAEIYRQLLEELGYTVTAPEVMGTDEFYPAVAEGEVTLWPNGWIPLHNTFLNQEAIAANSELIGSEVRGGALQGYLIDQATADAQNITSLEALQQPEIAELFDLDGNGKADLIGCNPEGWACAEVIEHHLDAYDLRDTVEQVQGDYADLMRDTLERFENGEPVLFYTWTPNWPLGRLIPGEDVVWLEVPFASLPNGMAAQEEFTQVPEVAGCASDPCNTGFPINDIRVVANSTFLERHPSVKRLLELVEIPLDAIVEQNAAMFFGENSAEDIERQAENWIIENRAQVDGWLEQAAAWEEQPTLERVRERGVLRCGLQEDLQGFGFRAEDGNYRGFNADFCRAVAAAVLGDAGAVEFVPLSVSERFAALSDRQVDVLFYNVAWTALPDVGMNPPNSGISLAFGPIIFHDGQRFMVRSDSGIDSLEGLADQEICVLANTATEQTLIDQFAVRNISFDIQRFDTADALYDTYERGGCAAVTGDASELVARRAAFVNPDDHTILNTPISREPHSPVYNEGDPAWGEIVNWTVNATIYAEELRVNRDNVAELADTDNPDIARLLGQRGAIGEKLGLDNAFARNIIEQVGNYRDIYYRNLGPDTPIDLERGPNKTWNSDEGPGGLLNAAPFR
jgi:glycine betaine/proline transport system substrate-binding protein